MRKWHEIGRKKDINMNETSLGTALVPCSGRSLDEKSEWKRLLEEVKTKNVTFVTDFIIRSSHPSISSLAKVSVLSRVPWSVSTEDKMVSVDVYKGK